MSNWTKNEHSVIKLKGDLELKTVQTEYESYNRDYTYTMPFQTEYFATFTSKDKAYELRFKCIPMNDGTMAILRRLDMVTTTTEVGEGGGGIKHPQITGPKKPPATRTPKPKKVK